MELFELVLGAVLSLIILFILTKIMGYRQLTQMSFFDYVIGISIGSIAAEMATDLTLKLWQPILAMVIYAAGSLAMSFLTIKSIKARRFIVGVPVVLIHKGKIIRQSLKKVHYDLNDLLCDARTQGYFDLSDIEYAVMENTGRISFLPKSGKRFVTPEDINFQPQQETLQANVIMDGKIMENHLQKIGKDVQWLKNELKKQHLTVEETFLAISDNSGKLVAFKNDNTVKGKDIFM